MQENKCTVVILLPNFKQDIDNNTKHENLKDKLKISPIIIAVGVTLILCATVSTVAINKIFDNKNKQQVEFFNDKNNSSELEKTDTENTTSSTAAISKGADINKVKRSTTKKTTTKIDSELESNDITDQSNEQTFDFPADINTVTYDQLIAIDGVGPATAEKIIDYRNNHGKIVNLDLLLEINGIGTSTLEKLKGYLYVSENDYEDISIENNDSNDNNASPNQNHTNPPNTTTKDNDTTTKITTQITTIKQMKQVNINTATAIEISDALLLDLEICEKIVELRNNIQYYSNSLELLYVDEISEQMLSERMNFIII